VKKNCSPENRSPKPEREGTILLTGISSADDRRHLLTLMNEVILCTDMSTFNDLISGKRPVLVDFFATWCGPCKTMSPILEHVKTQLKDAVRIVKIDVDKNQRVAQDHAVRGVPTLILFREGKPVWRQSGVVPADQLVAIIRQHAS
jgi:thioredoxin 1